MNTKSEIDEIMERVNLLWQRGGFEDALSVLKAAYQSFPENLALAYEYGHMLGELSSGKRSERKAERRLEAIEVLERLCRKLDGIDSLEQWKIRRHYYLYAGKHLENRALGYEEVKRGNPLGILSVGFGCLYQAIEMIDGDRKEEARQFAEEGKKAFETILRLESPKYGRLLAYALTLAILGHEREALDSTARAAEMMGENSTQLHEHREEMNRLLSMSGQVP